MTLPWRIWVLALTATAAVLAAVGMRTGMVEHVWPIGGLLVVAFLAPYGLSVWVGIALVALGLAMDLMTESPMGAWALALLAAYGTGLIGWGRQPPITVIAAEIFTVVGGAIAAALALMAAGGISGQQGLSLRLLWPDFLLTAALYPVLRFVFLPGAIREGRR